MQQTITSAQSQSNQASTDMHMHLLRVELPVLADVVPQVSVQVVRVVLHEGDLLQVARDILPVLFANAI